MSREDATEMEGVHSAVSKVKCCLPIAPIEKAARIEFGFVNEAQPI